MALKGVMTVAFMVFVLSLAVIPFASSDNQIVFNSKNVNARNISHNLYLGTVGYYDRLLYHQIIHVRSRFFRKVSHDVVFPRTHYSTAIISAIRVQDLKTDGTGGFPSIKKGGIGQRNVTIALHSQSGHGLHFNVTIYGH